GRSSRGGRLVRCGGVVGHWHSPSYWSAYWSGVVPWRWCTGSPPDVMLSSTARRCLRRVPIGTSGSSGGPVWRPSRPDRRGASTTGRTSGARVPRPTARLAGPAGAPVGVRDDQAGPGPRDPLRPDRHRTAPRRRDPLGAGPGGPARGEPGDGAAGDRRPGGGRGTGTRARQGHLRHRPAGRLPVAPDLVLPGDAGPWARAGDGGVVGDRGGGRRRHRLRVADPADQQGGPGGAAAHRRRVTDGLRGRLLSVGSVP